MTLRALLCQVITLGLFADVATAGLRGPGSYTGIVLFDRWGGCYLYSAIYLAPVAENQKDSLRAASGLCVTLDVTEAFQPINPGDALLRKFKWVGEGHVDTTYEWEKAEQATLKASIDLTDPHRPKWKLVIRNNGPTAMSVRAEDIAATIFSKKPAATDGKQLIFEPSDGPSYALVTRQSLYGAGDVHWEGERLVDHQHVTWRVSNAVPADARFELPVGATKEFIVDLSLPPGEYDLVFGYGGGTHESLTAASPLIAVDVGVTGEATSLTVKRE